MTESEVFQESCKETSDLKQISGHFLASTKIGFNLVSFSYKSLVDYKNPSVPVKISKIG